MHRSLFYLFAGLFPVCSTAQTSFVEGSLVYQVSLQPANAQESVGTQAGTYTLTLKGKQVRRELLMTSGYHSVTIFDGRNGTGTFMQSTPEQRYAIPLSATDMAKRRAPWDGFAFKPDGKPQTVAGQSCQPGTAVYPQKANGPSLCLGSLTVSPDIWLFSRFPGLTAIPVQFEYRNKDGSTVRFRLDRVETSPVEAARFRIPADYKVLSASEMRDASE